MKLGIWTLIIIGLIVFGPFITIWSLNTLFPVLNIPYTIDTWVAIVFMGMFFKGNVVVKK